MNTHDYTQRYWGHDYTWQSVDGGLTANVLGWGIGLRTGDYLLLPNRETPDGKTRYQIKSIRYYRDPNDMWDAKLVFAPRKVVE